MKKLFYGITRKNVYLNLLGSLILAFGLSNIHAYAQVTEGGVLGLTLLLRHFFGITPAVTSFLCTLACYIFAFRTLGREFLIYSAIAAGSYSLFYRLFELFAPVYPPIAQMPLTGAIIGAVFVGVGVGLCVRAGGAPTGDDALAMSLSHRLHVNIRWVYLLTDLAVLGASVTYLSTDRLLYSLLSVLLSGLIIGHVSKKHEPSNKNT